MSEKWPPDLRAHAADYAYHWADKPRWLRSRAHALLARVLPPPDNAADRNQWEAEHENELRMAGELSLIADLIEVQLAELAGLEQAADHAKARRARVVKHIERMHRLVDSGSAAREDGSDG